jgi:hypothetical protein
MPMTIRRRLGLTALAAGCTVATASLCAIGDLFPSMPSVVTVVDGPDEIPVTVWEGIGVRRLTIMLSDEYAQRNGLKTKRSVPNKGWSRLLGKVNVTEPMRRAGWPTVFPGKTGVYEEFGAGWPFVCLHGWTERLGDGAVRARGWFAVPDPMPSWLGHRGPMLPNGARAYDMRGSVVIPYKVEVLGSLGDVVFWYAVWGVVVPLTGACLHRAVAKRRRASGRCGECGYVLGAPVRTCPECGRETGWIGGPREG